MTVFLTPDGRPFWGGTYSPPAAAATGMPSFTYSCRCSSATSKGGIRAGWSSTGRPT